MINKLPLLPHSRLSGSPGVQLQASELCGNFAVPTGRILCITWWDTTFVTRVVVFSIELSKRWSIADITSGFYQQWVPNSCFPSEARAFLATCLLKPQWVYFLLQKYISYDWALWAINILEVNQKSKMHLIHQHESQSEDATKRDCPFTTEWDKTGSPNFPKCHPGTNTTPSYANDTSKHKSKLKPGCPFAIFWHQRLAGRTDTRPLCVVNSTISWMISRFWGQ